MKKRTECTQELPQYLYQILPDGTADCLVSKFITTETRIDEEHPDAPYTVYIYDINQFNVNTQIISEEEIKNNLDKYLDYEITTYTLEERTQALENAITEIAEVLFND